MEQETNGNGEAAVSAPLTVLRLTVEGFKQIIEVDVAPAPQGITRVTGANGAGKSSLLDSVWWALAAGKDGAVDEPVRRGARAARVTLDLGEIVVTRVADEAGQRLLVRRGEAKVPAGQTLLDSLRAKLGFDPGEFERAPSDRQREMLLDAMGLRDQLRAVEEKRAVAYAQRTEVNRQAKDVEARLKTAPCFDGVPDEEVSAAALSGELQAAMAETARLQAACVAAQNKGLEADRLRSRGERQLSNAEDLARQAEKARAEAVADLAHADALKAEAQAEAEALKTATLPDCDSIRHGIAEAEKVNALVRQRRQVREAETHLAAKRAEAEALTVDLARIDAEKTAMLATSRLPVDAIGFNEAGVTIGGLPWGQCAKSERMKVSLAVAMALNPRLRVVLVRDASLLDEVSVRVVEEMALGRGYQVLMEFVREDAGSGASIHIIEGRVAGAIPAPERAEA